MTRIHVLAALAIAAAPATAHAQAADTAHAPPPQTSAFAVTQRVAVSGTPEQAFAAITGDILPWWDHHVFAHPLRMYLEPHVGGCFCELADTAGNGVRHAVVTVVDRPRMIRFEGPLGLTGLAVAAVTTYTFQARGDSTDITVEFHAAGELPPGISNIVGGVWHHFLVEQFKPWYERTRGHR